MTNQAERTLLEIFTLILQPHIDEHRMNCINELLWEYAATHNQNLMGEMQGMTDEANTPRHPTLV